MVSSPDPDKPAPASSLAPGVAARAAALRLLDGVLRRGLPLESLLDKATRGLDLPEDRALAHAIAGAVLRHLTDLDLAIDSATRQRLPDDAKARFVLRIALAQTILMGTPPHAAIATALPLVDGGPRKLVHGVFGSLTRGGAILPQPPHLPEDVAARWGEAWGDDVVEAAMRSSAALAPLDLSLRAVSETAVWAERLGAVSLAPGHLRLPAGTRIAELEGFADGAFWAQDIAAAIPARLLGAGEGLSVLDLCAAPGGKTMQLAAARWRVTAVDAAETRVKRLRENLQRMKMTVDVRIGDALTFAPEEPVDAVLLDAPCSATGIFRRHPDVLHRVRPRAIQQMAERQQAMLVRAAGALKPGGRLVYAVCSLEPEEGERTIEAFLASHGGFRIEPPVDGELPAGIAAGPEGWVRVLPGTLEAEGGADGFFIARLRQD
ncbi:RsmB/NOP family class I SAM-dependent RNA methyltransferase [Sphingomonas sp. AP4-R1]|uniref:RsmB/NOP family class I SAM-dependent RNA methyltransferase n=1 Tax=Sphingomonas sp. AP4-R1 TaxID=2735134 RepID=UPI0014932E4E|nr:RsmB/NOP family class I SAM-dependent RNA methyltransferase [Sphingomonas sp. AP4-R1]QJU56909.1 RsmB/NOP family class I SAM-dependent RNA methyltransferase [Sphingomonas sp. AP4-R1]